LLPGAEQFTDERGGRSIGTHRFDVIEKTKHDFDPDRVESDLVGQPSNLSQSCQFGGAEQWPTSLVTCRRYEPAL
jgi:hypothetical protein